MLYSFFRTESYTTVCGTLVKGRVYELVHVRTEIHSGATDGTNITNKCSVLFVFPPKQVVVDLTVVST